MTAMERPHAKHAPHSQGHGAACGCGHEHAAPFDASALLSARGLCFDRNGRTVLDHIDCDLKSGEIVTLIGPNGSGKTTLVRLLLGVERPDRGEIRRAEGLRIGYVPQRFDVDRALPMTVMRFLTLGIGTQEAAVGTVLREVGAERCARQQLSALSGGELQRVLLARALLGQPNLLVLDEPVRGVDQAGEAELYALIGKIRDERRVGILLVSHDLHVVMAASDRVLCLNRHICCSGIPETVAQHPEYQRLFSAAEARAFALYRHHHDHSHDLDGAPHAAPHEAGEGTPR
ncbi:MAG: metal ABC transporter ATP-binding protein [Hyphomicrobium sp.]|nr:metal ABC transporter ATP-binding protein [Hyphomicrobium sp.]